VPDNFSTARRKQFLRTIADTPRLALLVKHFAFDCYYDLDAFPMDSDDEDFDFDDSGDDRDIDELLSLAGPAMLNLNTFQLTEVAWPR